MRQSVNRSGRELSRGPRSPLRLLAGAFLALAMQSAYADRDNSIQLASLSLEELANIQITSVSKKVERLSDAAASVYVITNEALRRSGATSLPDALRLAPNLQVARISAQNYAISARGFNSSTANKLLVLIDGRTVYTPLYSGVFWDAQDIMLDDVDRIEVISGPGGTLWGTNAVNGVINVIMRAAKDTSKGLLAASISKAEPDAAFRYGGEINGNTQYRVYGRTNRRDHTSTERGSAVHDGWNNAHAGFRVDTEFNQDLVTAQGELMRANLDQLTLPGRADVSGLNVLTRWHRSVAGAASIDLAAYYDRTERNFPGSYHETLDIVDIQLEHALPKTGMHAPVWGASYRRSNDRMDNSKALAFLPAQLHQSWSSLFVQDDFQLGDSVHLMGGVRLERNDYTGLETLPNIRLSWKPDSAQLLWSSLSRAVRAPSRIDRDFFAPSTAPFVLAGNDNFRSELANVLEVGYRSQPSAELSYSATLFYADYDYLRSLERLASGVYVIGNKMEGSNHGIEAWATYQATPNLRLSGGATAMRQNLHLKAGSNDASGTSGAGNDPRHTWQLRAAWDASAGISVDVTLRAVGALPRPAVPSYHALDLRFGWQLRPGLELSLVAKDLLAGKHPEFGTLPNRSEIGPRATLKLVWRY